MDSDHDLLRFLDLLEGAIGASAGPSIRLRSAFPRNLPWIKHYVQSSHQSEWSLNEYIERLYKRLRNRTETIDDFDQAIEFEMRSLVHEDLRNQTRRFTRAASVYFREAGAEADPDGLRFVAAVVDQDKLKKFMALLDPWTVAAFCQIYLKEENTPRATIAQKMGMTEDAFNKRYQRGKKRAIKEYLKIYGPL